MRKIVILEDDEIVRNHLCKIIENVRRNIEIYCVADIKEAYLIAIEHQIHLFLVDIILKTKDPGDVSGLQFVKDIRDMKKYEFTPIVFITCMQDPKLYAYSQLNCLKFIEKPFDEVEVAQVVKKALNFPVVPDHDKFAYFRNDGITYSICLEDIYYIVVNRKNIKIYYKNGDLEAPYKTCKDLIAEFGSDFFVQCSRSTIINKRYIEHVDYTQCLLKLKHVKEPIEIGAIMKNRFRDNLNE